MPYDKTKTNLRDNSCRHFNGFGRNKNCEAGCNYLEMCGGVHDGLAIRLPCSGHFANAETRSQHPELVPIECPKFEKKTAADIQAERDLVEQLLEQMRISAPWISEKKKSAKRDVVHEDECPVCKGRIKFRISSYNQHMHAKCATADCINFME